jgi:hypothetical protein
MLNSPIVGVIMEQEEEPNTNHAIEEEIVPPMLGSPSAVEYEQQIKEACRDVISIRRRPLLVIYYPEPDGTMMETDVAYCYQACRRENVTNETPLPECDVLIHTLGGDPVAAYKMGQVVRDMCQNVACLVPEHAYSAGTLFCFASNEIRLGHYSGLSPIDITQEEVQLTSIDYFLEFVRESEEQIRKVAKSKDKAYLAVVASDLLCQLVEQVGALKVGEYYRARTLAGHYAQELLDSYMLVGFPNARGRRNRIIRELLFEAPSHLFHIDYHMCIKLGLVIAEMGTAESDATKHLIDLLEDLTGRGVICPYVMDDLQMPFIALYR